MISRCLLLYPTTISQLIKCKIINIEFLLCAIEQFSWHFFLLLSIYPIYAQNNKKINYKLKNQISKRYRSHLKTHKKKLKNNKKTTEQIKLIDNQVKNYESLISKINAEMALLDREINNKKESIAKLKTELNILREQYSRMIYFAYLT